MKRHFWLILALVSLLGMIIVPGMVHSAEIYVPLSKPLLNIPSLVLAIHPVANMASNPLQILALAPKLYAGAAPVPTIARPIAATVLPAIAVPTVARHGALATLVDMNTTNGGDNVPSQDKITAQFDGTKQPAPTPADPPKKSSDRKDLKNPKSKASHLTLPEWDLEQEIGLSNF